MLKMIYLSEYPFKYEHKCVSSFVYFRKKGKIVQNISNSYCLQCKIFCLFSVLIFVLFQDESYPVRREIRQSSVIAIHICEVYHERF